MIATVPPVSQPQDWVVGPKKWLRENLLLAREAVFLDPVTHHVARQPE